MSREEHIINTLKSTGNLRTLTETSCAGVLLCHNGRTYVNLSSNDYLGLSARLDIQDKFLKNIDPQLFAMSNPSSRLMCGNSSHYTELEHEIASLCNTENSLVSGSGYLLNSSLPRAITASESRILADKFIHASLNDGLRLADCPFERFRHNDMNHLEQLLKKDTLKHTVVIIESLYSMDGDFAPFREIEILKAKYNFELVVDEAHAFGVFGDKGAGFAPDSLEIEYKIATLGKACASTGAFVACNSKRKELLVNKMRSTIFSTALPPINLIWSSEIIRLLPSLNSEREHLQRLIQILNGQSQIIPVKAGSNEKAIEIGDKLKYNNFWATAIRHPTVAKGHERVRISLTAAHTTQQIKELCKLIG